MNVCLCLRLTQRYKWLKTGRLKISIVFGPLFAYTSQ
jgi:hypothetical protein